MYQAGYPGLHKSQESFPVQVLSAGNTKGSLERMPDFYSVGIECLKN